MPIRKTFNFQLLTFNFQSGQTILEVLVALTLAIFFLSGVVVVELYAVRNVAFGQNKSLATKLARQQLERARVVRDSSGVDALFAACSSTCYINEHLTPVPVTPTGIYGQSLRVESSADCPIPSVLPVPTNFKMISIVSWAQEAVVTPAPEVELSSCISDWR